MFFSLCAKEDEPPEVESLLCKQVVGFRNCLWLTKPSAPPSPGEERMGKGFDGKFRVFYQDLAPLVLELMVFILKI